MEAFNNVVLSIKDFLWGPIMLCLLIGTHVLLTIRTKGIQRKTFTGVKLSVTPDKEASGDIGGFAALATALAATIGTGTRRLYHEAAPKRIIGMPAAKRIHPL